MTNQIEDNADFVQICYKFVELDRLKDLSGRQWKEIIDLNKRLTAANIKYDKLENKKEFIQAQLTLLRAFYDDQRRTHQQEMGELKTQHEMEMMKVYERRVVPEQEQDNNSPSSSSTNETQSI